MSRYTFICTFADNAEFRIPKKNIRWVEVLFHPFYEPQNGHWETRVVAENKILIQSIPSKIKIKT